MSHVCTLFLAPFVSSPNFAVKNCRFHFKIPKNTRNLFKISCSGVDSSQNQQQQLNLSVLRFTLGIPGLDESYLPRWIGYAFGSLLVLNHFVTSSSTSVTPAQLVSNLLAILYFFSIFPWRFLLICWLVLREQRFLVFLWQHSLSCFPTLGSFWK